MESWVKLGSADGDCGLYHPPAEVLPNLSGWQYHIDEMEHQDDATLVITPGGGRRWSHPPRKLRDTRVQEPEREASLMHCSGRLTAALVQGMWNCVERVVLGYYGPVELDWDTLLTYDGRGHCVEVQFYADTATRYWDQLANWGQNMGWSVWRNSNGNHIWINRN